MPELLCHCTHVDGRVYPEPNHPCPNGHGLQAVAWDESRSGGYTCPNCNKSWLWVNVSPERHTQSQQSVKHHQETCAEVAP